MLAEKPKEEERWYQAEAVEALFEYCMKPHKVDADGKIIPRNPLICLPPGTGKSHVIAKFLKQAFEMLPRTRVIMATHVKELIKQNAAKLQEAWPVAPLGFYSAALVRAETVQPIIFGGIQSMVNKYPKFGHRDILIIDEAHLLNDDGSYLTFINELQQINPYLIVIGLTATPYRLGMGLLTNGKIFTDIIYNLCDIDGFDRLIAQGYLCPVIPKRGNIEIDISQVGMSGGDFNQKQLQLAANKRELTLKALPEFIAYGQDRRSWLIFASGVEHVESIAGMLNDMFHVPTVVMHSKRTDTQNDEAMLLWKTGQVRCAVNMGMLTTGIDSPVVDYIGFFRPTMSTGLWVQMQRGTRPFSWNKLSPADKIKYKAFEGYEKENCLVMDYAGNTRRLGPINDPVIPRRKGEGAPGDAPVRLCPACGVYNHARAVQCIACGTVFPINEKLNTKASSEELLRSDLPQIETIAVDRVVYSLHTAKATGTESIKASYYCGLRTFSEWRNFESTRPYAKHQANEWFRQRYPSDPPASNSEVLQMASVLRAPVKIRVWLNKKYPEVLSAEF